MSDSEGLSANIVKPSYRAVNGSLSDANWIDNHRAKDVLRRALVGGSIIGSESD